MFKNQREPMTDKQFILFLCTLLYDDLSDGVLPDEGEFDIIYEELLRRNLDPEPIFPDFY